MTLDDDQVQAGRNLLLTFEHVRNTPGEGNDIFDRAVALAGGMAAASGKDVRATSIKLGYALNRAETVDAQKLVLAEFGGTS